MKFLSLLQGFAIQIIVCWKVRGPLDVLREKWETSKKSDESVLSLVRDRRVVRVGELEFESGTEVSKEMV